MLKADQRNVQVNDMITNPVFQDWNVKSKEMKKKTWILPEGIQSL